MEERTRLIITYLYYYNTFTKYPLKRHAIYRPWFFENDQGLKLANKIKTTSTTNFNVRCSPRARFDFCKELNLVNLTLILKGLFPLDTI